jgi:hypothetical protein
MVLSINPASAPDEWTHSPTRLVGGGSHPLVISSSPKISASNLVSLFVVTVISSPSYTRRKFASVPDVLYIRRVIPLVFQFARRAHVVSATILAPVTENADAESITVTARNTVGAVPNATSSPTLSQCLADAVFVNLVAVAVPAPLFVGAVSMALRFHELSTLPVLMVEIGDGPDSSPSTE